MRAVILAGGQGIRLRPYTTCIPKPLVPIGDEMTIIEVLIRQLKRQGFTEIFLALGHMGHLIRSFVGDGSQWGISIECWDEDAPLGTAGPLIGHVDELPEHFLVMNSDVLCTLDMGAMLRRHIAQAASLTIASYARKVKVDFGVLDVVGDRLGGFREKPEYDYKVSMGIYGVSRSLFEGREVAPLGFDDLLLGMLAAGNAPHIHHFDGYWLDIGRPDDYDRANHDFARLRNAFLGLPEPVGASVIDLAEIEDRRASREEPSNGTAVNGSNSLQHASVGSAGS